MIILNGTLRQSGVITISEKPQLKLWIEHLSERDNSATPDLKIEEIFVSPDSILPPAGSEISVVVRPWVSGKTIRFSGVKVLPAEPKKSLTKVD